ncbi:MAG TPA: hypothetical protein VGH28_11155 [Polyangiaceae bacterium]|jgi:hypothetical protein
MRLAVAAVASACLVAACAPSVRGAAAPDPSQAEWDAALARLARLRAALPRAPYSQPVTVDFFEPRSRRHFEGRGAVGVDPGHAMRMILVGPAGEPALDVWVTRDAWRLVVPAIHLVRRGGRETPSGSPVGFFRSWFVDPLGGHLLALGAGGELVLRDPFGGTLHVTRADGDGFGIRRRSGTQTETFESHGAHASYRDASSGLSVEVTLGPVGDDAPDPEAFADPGASP